MEVTADRLATARKRLLQMHFESGVGHIGGNLSCLDAMLVAHHEFITEEDRFILSKGHSAGALYITLWTLGVLTDYDLTRFHKDDTLLAGHPPSAGIKDILFATGSLGHGLSLAAGTALALKFKKSKGRVICVTSDGEWQEGSTWEAMIFAAHHGLDNLTVLVDKNNLQGFGGTDEVASMIDLRAKLQGFNLDVQSIDGHNLEEIRDALQPRLQSKCKIVILNTTKGRGVSFMENRMEWHYLPLQADQFSAAIAELNSQ